MNNSLLTITGCLLVILGVWETFMAVLYPRAGTGPLTSWINRLFHNVLKSRASRSRYVTLFSGPLLIGTQVLAWATLLLVGTALIVWTQLGSGITTSSSKPTDTGFVTAMYYAGFTITTLGVGDLVPRTRVMQILTFTVAGLGFSFFTLVLAYVISIYSALARRNQFACEIDYRTGRTGDTLQYLLPYLISDNTSLVNQDLYSLASNMAELLESHHFYPSLHYFRFAEQRYAMSRMLRFCLEIATILKSLREVGGPTASSISEPAERLWHASLQMLGDTRRNFIVCHGSDNQSHDEMAKRIVEALAEAGTSFNSFDGQQFANVFQQKCQAWSDDLQAVQACMGESSSRTIKS